MAYPASAMDSAFPTGQKGDKKVIVVTEEQKKRFSQHLSMAVGFSNKVVEQGEISGNNSLHLALHHMSETLTQCGGDVNKMIELQDLTPRLITYKSVDSDSEIRKTFALMYNKPDNIEELKAKIIDIRRTRSAEVLQGLQPNFSAPIKGELQTNARIGFMKRNENYPVDEQARKDYTSLLIYQLLFLTEMPESQQLEEQLEFENQTIKPKGSQAAPMGNVNGRAAASSSNSTYDRQ